MHCCGVTSYEDWYDISSWPGERWVPESCCRPVYNETFSLVEGSGDDMPDVNCGKSMNPALWWDRGCTDVFQMWILHRLHVVGTVGLVIGFLQVPKACSNLIWNSNCFRFSYLVWSLQCCSSARCDRKMSLTRTSHIHRQSILTNDSSDQRTVTMTNNRAFREE